VDEVQKLLSRTDILGLGESFWQALLNDPNRMLPVFEVVLSNGKSLEGHSAGAADKKLNAYVAAGITSCHEPILAQEALDRLRLGLYVMIREGSIRRDLKDIAALSKTEVDTRRLILVTDGISPKDLLEKGYMEYVVQKAMDYGFSFMQAVQMATLNPATHFNLDHMIGGIAPGRYADLAILPDTSTIQPDLVIGKGRIIAQHGRCIVAPRAHKFQPGSMDSVHLPAPLTATDFQIPINDGRDEVTLRAINMTTDLVSAETQITLPVTEGKITTDPSQDIGKIAAINRTNNPGQMSVGLIRGFGMKSGAFASSTGWDLADIIAIGARDADLALAVNRIADLKGGVVVCSDGRVIAELALPVMGLMANDSIQDLAANLDSITFALRSLGVEFRDPLLALSALTGAAIPFLRICEHGLVNLKTGPCSLIVS
jgi:adenine deaminase